MRVWILVIAVLCAILGAAFGALNAQPVPFDFLLANITLPAGPAMLAALALGWALGGGCAWAGIGLARRRKLRAARRGGGA